MNIENMLEKVNPYSEQGIYNALYFPIVDKWSGLSYIEHKEEVKKKFPDFIRDIINVSIKESSGWYEDELTNYVSDYIDNRVYENNEVNVKSFETKQLMKLNQSLKKRKEKNNDFNIENFYQEIKEYIKSNYIGFDRVKPKELKRINENNIISELNRVKISKDMRLSNFKGLEYKFKGTFHFIDYIEPAIVYYNKTQNKDENEIDSLVKGIISYSLKVNMIKNTKEILYKLKQIKENDLKVNNEIFNFDMVLINETKSTNFQKKSQLSNLDNLLNKK